MYKMSTIHTNTRTQTTTTLRIRCRDDGVVQQPSLPQQTFFQLLRIIDPRTVNLLLKDTPDAVVHRINPANWVATSLGMNSGVSSATM